MSHEILDSNMTSFGRLFQTVCAILWSNRFQCLSDFVEHKFIIFPQELQKRFECLDEHMINIGDTVLSVIISSRVSKLVEPKFIIVSSRIAKMFRMSWLTYDTHQRNDA